jgi:hypothetical protein
MKKKSQNLNELMYIGRMKHEFHDMKRQILKGFNMELSS